MEVNNPAVSQETSGAIAVILRWFNVNPLVNLVQLVVAASLLVLLLTRLIQPQSVSHWRIWGIIMLLGLIWLTARWVGHRYGANLTPKVTLLWLLATFLLTEAVNLITLGEFPHTMYAILPIIAIFYLSPRWSLAITVATVCWVAAGYLFLANVRDEYLFQTLILHLTIFLAGAGLAYALRQERQAKQEAQLLLGELADSNEQLTRYAAEVAQLATMRERNRIAREIHDSLGHYLTVVGVQLEKAITFDGVNQQETSQALFAAKQLTDQALFDVRSSVSALRETEESFTLKSALQTLMQNVAQSGLAVDFRLRGDESGFSEQQRLTLFRAVQEGLTNVQKHAHAKEVKIVLELDAEAAVLHLVDDGIGFSEMPIHYQGYGLQGLRERVELVQGTMQLKTIPGGGAELTVKIPKEVKE